MFDFQVFYLLRALLLFFAQLRGLLSPFAVHFALDSSQFTLVGGFDLLQLGDLFISVVHQLLEERDFFLLSSGLFLVPLQGHEFGWTSMRACYLSLLQLHLQCFDLGLRSLELVLEFRVICGKAGKRHCLWAIRLDP